MPNGKTKQIFALSYYNKEFRILSQFLFCYLNCNLFAVLKCYEIGN